ncbi:MAG: 30S ribosomal protein S2 [bacterium]
MPRVTLQQLLLAGSHFGHLTRRWHPRMKPFILTERNKIHLIDLRKTLECLEKACDAVRDIAARGEQILYVGTKKQAKDIIRIEAERAHCPYVTERWLGGMLTNFATIRRGLKTLVGLEKKVTDGTYDKLTKKERLSLDREREKLVTALGGIRELKRLPGAVFVVDVKREHIAVSEANRLGIPVIAIVDTNVDPEPIPFVIPANDDAFKSIGLITRALTDAIVEGQAFVQEIRPVEEMQERPAPRQESDMRPSRRPPKRMRRRTTPRPPKAEQQGAVPGSEIVGDASEGVRDPGGADSDVGKEE